MERSPFIRLAGIAIVFLSSIIGSWILFGPGSVTHVEIPEKDFHRFSGVMGPSHTSVVEPAVPADWTTYSHGTTSRLAILLTDTDSSWLGLAHGLKSIGIPFKITRDVQEALRHDVVLVYPVISGKVLSPDALTRLGEYPRAGGTLVGVQVQGGGLNQVFGFHDAVASRQRYDIRLSETDPLLASFTEPRERQLRVGVREKGIEVLGT